MFHIIPCNKFINGIIKMNQIFTTNKYYQSCALNFADTMKEIHRENIFFKKLLTSYIVAFTNKNTKSV